MTKEKKPRYKLKPRSKNYVLLCEGEHCLAAICTKKPRGLLDASLLLTAMNSHEGLLDVCRKIKTASSSAVNTREFLIAFDDCDDELEAAIENAKQL